MKSTRLLAALGCILPVVIGLTTIESSARKIRTKLPIGKSIEVKSNHSERDTTDAVIYILKSDDRESDFDSIKNQIRFYGYDKTVNSTKESFFVVNECDYTIENLTIEITYYDMQGRQLHQLTRDIEANIPPHQTRRKDISSWDTQKSFYFYQSAKPRRQATPFDVSIKLKMISLLP